MDRHWRLILDGSCGSAYNMAVDEVILRAHIAGLVPPTVRLYGWDGPAISLGYLQSSPRAGLDEAYCCEAGISIVRRITGGRAVLHGHDLTFGVIVAENLVPEGSRNVRSSHRWLMSGIVAGLRRLGLEAEMGSDVKIPPVGTGSADCFAHAAACDICIGGMKAAGAAQVRRNGAILEQGSIPFQSPSVDRTRIFTAGCSDEAVPITGIERSVLVEALVAGLAEALPATFVRDSLSKDERLEALSLERGKYASEAWTRRDWPVNVDNRIVSALY